MSLHCIRLRKPWDPRVADPATDAEGVPSVDGTRLADRFASAWIVWRRRFQRPTGLAANQRVDLVIDAPAAVEKVLLNGEELVPASPTVGSAGELRFPIEGMMRPANELEIHCRGDRTTASTLADPQSPPADHFREARLEIWE